MNQAEEKKEKIRDFSLNTTGLRRLGGSVFR
jgi:hypothetical protein